MTALSGNVITKKIFWQKSLCQNNESQHMAFYNYNFLVREIIEFVNQPVYFLFQCRCVQILVLAFCT